MPGSRTSLPPGPPYPAAVSTLGWILRPMPFMERIDDYGIAFHGGVNPGYPASHGCMRLPMKFAEKLYGVTRIGTKVVIEG